VGSCHFFSQQQPHRSWRPPKGGPFAPLGHGSHGRTAATAAEQQQNRCHPNVLAALLPGSSGPEPLAWSPLFVLLLMAGNQSPGSCRLRAGRATLLSSGEGKHILTPYPTTGFRLSWYEGETLKS
jgi:hypothetical protein